MENDRQCFWQKEYAQSLLIWIMLLAVSYMLKCAHLEIFAYIIALIALVVLFYASIRRFHDLNNPWFYAFFLFAPLIGFFVIFDLLIRKKVIVENTEDIRVLDLGKDLKSNMKILAIIIVGWNLLVYILNISLISNINFQKKYPATYDTDGEYNIPSQNDSNR